MKKILILFLILVSIVFGTVFTLLFTSYGNGLIAQYLENKVNNEQDKVKFKVDNLKLSFKTLDFNATIDDNSHININGDFAIFDQSADLKYDIKVNDLKNLKSLINQDLNGPFFTNGIFKGDFESSLIQGISNFASGETKYIINLESLNINSVDIDSKDLKIDEFLTLLNQPIYAKGLLSLDAKLTNIKENNIDGILKASIKNALLNNEVINKEFKQTLGFNTNFQSNITSTFSQNKALINGDILSSLVDLYFENTQIDLSNYDFLSNYKIDIKSLEKFEGIIGKKLKGEFLSKGIINGDKKEIFIEGNSNIVDGETSYKVNIKEGALKNIDLKVKDAKVEKLLKILDEPVYLTGDFELNSNIKNPNLEKLDGILAFKLKNTKVINEVVNTVFNQELKEVIILNSEIDTKLLPNQAISKIDLKSSIADLNIEKLVFDFSNSSLSGAYVFTANSLDKLKDFTKIPLKGDMKILGNIAGSTSNLILDGKSTIANGNFDFLFNNSILKANLKDAHMKKFLYMLNQKEIFDSKLDLKLDYNTLIKKGNLEGDFIKGHFLATDFTKTVQTFSKLDLTKEIYENSKLNSQIDDKKIISVLDMNSKNSNINTQGALLDFEKNLIDALLNVRIKNDTFAVKLSGDMKKPNIALDVKDLVEKNIDKISEKLNKVLGKEADDPKTKKFLEKLKPFL